MGTRLSNNLLSDSKLSRAKSGYIIQTLVTSAQFSYVTYWFNRVHNYNNSLLKQSEAAHHVLKSLIKTAALELNTINQKIVN